MGSDLAFTELVLAAMVPVQEVTAQDPEVMELVWVDMVLDLAEALLVVSEELEMEV